MTLFTRVPYAAAIAAGLFALVSCWPAEVAAQQTPAIQPKIDLDTPKTPQSAPLPDTDKFKPAKTPQLEGPQGIDAGKPRLDLDVRRTQDVTAPGLDIDSGERSNLSKVVPGQRPDQVLPDYFGLKLTAPTR
jgi:hypothetical protein